MTSRAIAILAYLLLPGLLLLGGAERADSLIDPYSSTAAKGLLALYLVIHHFVQKMPERAWYLDPMAWFGFLIVGWFFLTSGYGTLLSCEKNGLRGFWKKKLKRIWLPFVLAVPIEGLLRLFLMKQEGSVAAAFGNALTLRTLDGKFMWYIATQIVMYSCFYLPYRFLKNKRICFVVMLALITVFDVVNIATRQPDYKWVTCSCFAVGVLLGQNRTRLRAWIGKVNLWGGVVLAAAVFLAVSVLLVWWHQRWNVFILTPLSACALALLTSRLRFRSKALHWLGTISFEIYITQLVMIELAIWHWGSSWKALLFALTASVLFAWLVSGASKALIARFEQIAERICRKNK